MVHDLNGSGELPGGAPNTALRQFQTRGYAGKYRSEPGVRLFELGFVFSRTTRNLVRFDYR